MATSTLGSTLGEEKRQISRGIEVVTFAGKTGEWECRGERIQELYEWQTSKDAAEKGYSPGSETSERERRRSVGIDDEGEEEEEEEVNDSQFVTWRIRPSILCWWGRDLASSEGKSLTHPTHSLTHTLTSSRILVEFFLVALCVCVCVIESEFCVVYAARGTS